MLLDDRECENLKVTFIIRECKCECLLVNADIIGNYNFMYPIKRQYNKFNLLGFELRLRILKIGALF